MINNRARWEGGSFGGTVVDNYAHQAELGMSQQGIKGISGLCGRSEAGGFLC